MKKKLWKKTAVALGFGFVVAGIGVGGNALYVNAEETDSSEPSTVQNTVLATPEMTKGYLHVTSNSPVETEPSHNDWGYVLNMKLMQTDLSEFSEFWWNLDAKGGAYANSTSAYTECFVGFEGNDGKNYVWTAPVWGTYQQDIVYYSSTFLGEKHGQNAGHFNVQLATHGNAWYSIDASKVTDATNDPHEILGDHNEAYKTMSCAKIWFNNKTYGVDLSIGALYGVRMDGSYKLLFDPSEATSDSVLDAANEYSIVQNGENRLTWTITKIEATNLMPLHDGIGVNNHFNVPIANVLPEDISAYNGISYYIDNSANNLPTDIQLVITDKGDDGAATQEELWYSDNQGFSFFYENSETAAGSYVVLNSGNQIPAGKKGTVVIPFSSFYQPWESNNKLFDLNYIKGDLTLVYHPQAETFAANYSIGKFTLVIDAKAEFKEYRLYQKADGSYPVVSVNGGQVSYSDTANIKEIARVETDGINAENMAAKASGIENENLYQYDKTEVKTEYTPVSGGGNVNGRVVPVTYYARKNVTVTFMDGMTEHAQKSVRWGGNVELPDNPFYSDGSKTFSNWYYGTLQDDAVEYGDIFDGTVAMQDITVYAKYGYRYIVKHYLQNLAGDGYDEQTADSENKVGDAGEATAAEAKAYTGFTAQAVTQGTITTDGNTVVNVYYTRNGYTVTFDVNGTKTQQVVKYGGKVEKPEDPSVEGYTFGGWKLNDSTFDFDTFTMGTSDITITATFEEIPAESGLPSWAIAVIVLGSVLAVSAAASVGIVVFLKKRKK